MKEHTETVRQTLESFVRYFAHGNWERSAIQESLDALAKIEAEHERLERVLKYIGGCTSPRAGHLKTVARVALATPEQKEPAQPPAPTPDLVMEIVRAMQKRADELAALCGDKPPWAHPSDERYYRNAGASTAIHNLANEIGYEFTRRAAALLSRIPEGE